MSMTKAELAEEIRELKTEIKRVEELEEYREYAGRIKSIYDVLIDVGFSKIEAWEIFMNIIRK